MIATDEDALTCDLAETYHIFKFRELPVNMLAVLSAGLRDDSRIKMKMIGANAPTETMLLADIADGMRTMVWMNSKDGVTGKNRPRSLVEAITIGDDRRNSNVVSFESGDDFEAARRRILQKGE